MALKWAWKMVIGGDGEASNDAGAIAVDVESNLYVAGSYSGLMQVSGLANNALPKIWGDHLTMFMIKWSPGGQPLWSGYGHTNFPFPKFFAYATDLALDDFGKPILIGRFIKTIDLLFPNSMTTLSPLNDVATNTYICQVETTGKIIRAQGIACFLNPAFEVWPGGISATKGAFYVAGHFTKSAKFGVLPNVITVNEPNAAQGQSSIFLAKYKSSGEVAWVKHSMNGGLGLAHGASVVANPLGVTFVTGFYTKNIVLGAPPGNVVFLQSAIGDNRVFFVASYDPTGNLLWAKSALSNNSVGKKIARDTANNVVAVGLFGGTMKFADNSLKCAFDNLNAFVARYSADGTFQWSIGGLSDQSVDMISVAISPKGSIFVAGNFYKSITFVDKASNVVNLTAGTNSSSLFVIELSANGKIVGSLVGVGGAIGETQKMALVAAANGSVYLTTGIWGEVKLLPTNLIAKSIAGHGMDVLIACIQTV